MVRLARPLDGFAACHLKPDYSTLLLRDRDSSGKGKKNTCISLLSSPSCDTTPLLKVSLRQLETSFFLFPSSFFPFLMHLYESSSVTQRSIAQHNT